MTRPEVAGSDPATLTSRMEKLEQKLNRLAAGTPAPAPTVPVAAPVAAPADDTPSSEASPGTVDQEPTAPSPAAEEPASEAPFEDAGGGRPPAEEAGTEIPEIAPVVMEAVPTAADLERVWPQLVAGVRNDLGARREAMLREAIPSGVEGSTLILVVPAHLDFHLEQLRSDSSLARYLADRAGQLLGGSVRVAFRSGGGADGDDAISGPGRASGEGNEPEVIPDKDSLEEAPAEGTDPLSLLQSELGAEVVGDE